MKYFLTSLAFLTALGLASVSAQTLTYDYATNPGWFTTDAWTNTVPAATDWSAGADAVIDVDSSKTITFDQSTTIGNLTVTGSPAFGATLDDTVARTLTFSGGDIDTSALFQTSGGVSIQGDFTKKGTGFIRLGGATAAAYVGTATVNAGNLEIATSAPVVGTSSNFIVNAGILQIRNTGTYNLGTIVLDGGTFLFSRANATSATIAATVSSLSGSGGIIQVDFKTSDTAGTHNATLNVNQAGNTTYSGEIEGYRINSHLSNESFLTLNKQGVGSLTLGGDINLVRETTVSGGTLLIDSSNATFTNGLDTTAIAVNAALGGTGTLQITDGDNVVVGATGSLIAGLDGSADQTTFNLSGGSLLNLSAATAGSATGWLMFDLGANTTAGTTYDRILLTGTGSLDIGTGLDFEDFSFNTLAGFGAGTYTLFATPSSIAGSLGTTTGTIGGLDGTLEISGNDLVLTVVPEPTTAAFVLSGFAFLLLGRRLRKRS